MRELWSQPFVRITPPISQKTVVMFAKVVPPGKPLRNIRRSIRKKGKKRAFEGSLVLKSGPPDFATAK
jgi:hypothetical protein